MQKTVQRWTKLLFYFIQDMNSGKKIGWFILCGALLWVAGGLLLSLRPAGHPPSTFRKSSDLIPLLALGLLLIGVSSGLNMLTFGKEGDKLFKAVCKAVVISSLSYALGVLIRQVFLQGTGWEPLMPFGFLAFIISWLFLGVLSLKKGFFSKVKCLVIVASAISLLSFNDQYNPYGAVVFGALSFFVVLLPEHNQKKFQRATLARLGISATTADG